MIYGILVIGIFNRVGERLMYRERDQKKSSALRDALLLFGAVAVLAVIAAIADALQKAYGLPFLNYIVYVLAIIFAVLLFRAQTFYEYIIDNDVLTFERGAGRRGKPVAIVELGRILEFNRYGQLVSVCGEKGITPQIIRATLGKLEQAMAVSFETGGGYYIVAFNPSEELRARIEQGMSAKRTEEGSCEHAQREYE